MAFMNVYYDLLSRVTPRLTFLPRSLSSLLQKVSYQLPITRIAPPRLALFEPDDVLGWRMRPDVVTTHPHFSFRATYTTDGAGHRVIPEGTGPAVTFLGCSWTFGFGVDDAEAYPALLAPAYRVKNLAVFAYGTSHQHLLMTRLGILEQSAREGATLIYGWFPRHLERSWRRRWWLEQVKAWGHKAPLFDIEDGRLTFRGLVGPSEASDDPDSLVSQMEWRITNDLLVAMKQAAEKAGVRLILLLLPLFDEAQARTVGRMRDRLERLDMEYIDLNQPQDTVAARRELFYLNDDHPRPSWHRIVAQRLAPELKGRLGP